MANPMSWRFAEHALPRVMWANLGYHRPGLRVAEHILPHQVLDVIIAGDASWTRNGQERRLVPGCAYLYGPGDSAGAGIIGSRGLRFVGIIFQWPALVHGEVGVPDTIALPPAELPEITGQLRRFVEAVQGGRASSQILGGRLARFLTQLAEWTQRPAPGAERDLAVRAMDMLRERRSHATAIPAIAHALGVGAAHLRKRMVERYGRPPLQLLNEIRLDELQRLLALERTTAIEQLAPRAGFADRRHASRLFLRRHGMTPQAYRASLPPV